MTAFLFGLIAVLAISLVSFTGVFMLSIQESRLKSLLLYFVSFAAGAMFGDVFLHIFPEMIEEGIFTLQSSITILIGIIVSFILEKIIHWRHCHLPFDKQHVHRFAYMNLFGDALHNFIDGLIIGASFIAGLPVGIATTIAVILHEIPQEVGDFAVLIHGGVKRTKALLLNFFTALTAVGGLIIAFLLQNIVEDMNAFLLSFAAGSFIYIAGSDLIPELHKEDSIKKGLIQLSIFIAGILVMASLLLLE